MTLDETIHLLHERGLSIRVEGGKPRLSGPKEACTSELLASLRQYRQQIIAKFTPAVPRRIVLLTGDRVSQVQTVIEEPEAMGCTGRARELAASYPGKTLAVEWRSRLGWVRYFWVSVPEENKNA